MVPVPRRASTGEYSDSAPVGHVDQLWSTFPAGHHMAHRRRRPRDHEGRKPRAMATGRRWRSPQPPDLSRVADTLQVGDHFRQDCPRGLHVRARWKPPRR